MTKTEWIVSWLSAAAILAIALAFGGCETAPTTITIPLPAVEYSEPPK